MGVIGGKAVAVVNFDQVAVGAFGSGPDHLAAGRGGDGGAVGGGDVQPPVEIFPAENLPPAEGRGDPARTFLGEYFHGGLLYLRGKECGLHGE